MNSILRSIPFLLSGADAYGKVSLKAQFGWDWDATNNCGPRPSGPAYPFPPEENEHGDPAGNWTAPANCDIIGDAVYVYNYACETSCQAEPEKNVVLRCHCLTQVGPIEIPIDCYWKYDEETGSCPETSDGHDWECDPRNGGSCPDGQYPADPNAPAFSGDMAGMMAMMAGMMSGFNQENFKYTTTNGNTTEMVQGGMPGYINHVVISPVMEQSIGDPAEIDLEPGEDEVDENGNHHQNARTMHGGVHGDMHGEIDPALSAQLIDYERELAAEKERSRSFKSRINEAADAFKRERLNYEALMHEKDEEREQILEQLHVLQALVNQKTHYSQPSENFDYQSEETENPRFSMFNDVDQSDIPENTDEVIEKIPSKRQIRRQQRRKEIRQSKKENPK